MLEGHCVDLNEVLCTFLFFPLRPPPPPAFPHSSVGDWILQVFWLSTLPNTRDSSTSVYNSQDRSTKRAILRGST